MLWKNRQKSPCYYCPSPLYFSKAQNLFPFSKLSRVKKKNSRWKEQQLSPGKHWLGLIFCSKSLNRKNFGFCSVEWSSWKNRNSLSSMAIGPLLVQADEVLPAKPKRICWLAATDNRACEIVKKAWLCSMPSTVLQRKTVTPWMPLQLCFYNSLCNKTEYWSFTMYTPILIFSIRVEFREIDLEKIKNKAMFLENKNHL